MLSSLLFAVALALPSSLALPQGAPVTNGPLPPLPTPSIKVVQEARNLDGLVVRQILSQASSCSRDNLFRCFTASPQIVSPFCASYTSAATITAPTPAATTTTAIVTLTSATTVGISVTATSTTIVTISTIQTTTAVLTSTISTTQTIQSTSGTLLNKRAPTPASPLCLTKDGSTSTSYPTSRITSACSCLYSCSTTTITPTQPTITVTSTTTTTPVVTLSSTVTVTVAQTQPATLTTTVTSVVETTLSVTTTAAPHIVGFTKVTIQSKNCAYSGGLNDLIDTVEVPLEAELATDDGDFGPAKNYCAAGCAAISSCKNFQLIKREPRHPLSGVYCYFYAIPCDPARLQCIYEGIETVGYDKVVV